MENSLKIDFVPLIYRILLKSGIKCDTIILKSIKNRRGILPHNLNRRVCIMKHIKTMNKANLKESAQKGGCGKCQASCQSACKTSCTVANQKCER
jgi:predicted ribosomally synthesized six-cysteine peptide SCIFF